MKRLSFFLLSGLLPSYMAALSLIPGAADAQEAVKGGAERTAFSVCADPNNLPFSNRKREGFENKIAELFAKEMGIPVEYTWFPQGFGFIRSTLRARVPEKGGFKCDVVIGVPAGYPETATTKPYLTSTYAMAFLKGHGLDDVKTQEDLLKLPPEQLKKLKFGVFAQSPPVDWLLQNKLFDQAVPYQKQKGDPARYPGEVVEKDLVEGKVDVVFVWGPIAGYFAKKSQNAQIAVVPMHSVPNIQLDYPISMGVRQPDKEWKAQLDKLIADNQGKINQILADYGVPVVEGKK